MAKSREAWVSDGSDGCLPAPSIAEVEIHHDFLFTELTVYRINSGDPSRTISESPQPDMQPAHFLIILTDLSTDYFA